MKVANKRDQQEVKKHLPRLLNPLRLCPHTEDIAETVVSGITLSETGEFDKFQSVMENLADG